MHRHPVTSLRFQLFLHRYHHPPHGVGLDLIVLVLHPGNRTNVRCRSTAALRIDVLDVIGHPDHHPCLHEEEDEVPHDIEVQAHRSPFALRPLVGGNIHPSGKRSATNLIPLTPKPTFNQIPGKLMIPSALHPIQPTLHSQRIHQHNNTPNGSHGQNGQTGTNPTTLPSQRDNGRTTKSPTIMKNRASYTLEIVKIFFFIFLSFWLSFYLSFFFIYVFTHVFFIILFFIFFIIFLSFYFSFFFIFFIFYHLFYHFFFQWCQKNQKNGKMQFSSNFFHFFIIFFSFLLPVVELMKNDEK